MVCDLFLMPVTAHLPDHLFADDAVATPQRRIAVMAAVATLGALVVHVVAGLGHAAEAVAALPHEHRAAVVDVAT